MLKRTALYEEHKKLGGRLIDFGGWELPVQYQGVMDEHLGCRNAVGLFDVSHMGEIHVEGAASEAFLNYLISNNVAKLAVKQALYSEMCNHTGGIVDDLLVYRRSTDRFLVVVNASNTDKDFAHIQKIEKEFKQKNPGATDLRITNESSKYTQIAVQGRHAEKIVQTMTKTNLSAIKYYWFDEGTVLNGIPAVIARTGYTGEDGFELYVPWDRGPEVWRACLEAGKPYGITPVGLGARDTLRLEMKFPLYGHELSDETNPFAAGVGWVVKLDKGDFVGRAPIVAAKEKGLPKQLVGLKLLERGVPRQGYEVYSADGKKNLGQITSGTQSPSLKAAIGLAYVDKDHAKIGTKLTVDIRGTKTAAEVIPTPFYKRPY
ncbi:MAG: glycine cleavage system protein T [Bdellovibrionales bacterium RIFOXYC1_FULL_54_43]|nr:MAG: glycine cleavage system protein T [Bdellovibrionales bacterium RIFOXYC1_FULL_54_43]OFZ81864.1 MAG: glycine cleavage system protein T [Bdellovibrionales bacterium RIFOXYD1_FULL_55_31]